MLTTYPFSAGHATALTRLPLNACDCHIHVYDNEVEPVPGAKLRPPEATVDDYRLIQARIGTQRAILVTPSTYGDNNAPMLAALRQLGTQGRGIAVINGQESDEHLQDMHKQGVRGVRINLSQGLGLSAKDIEPIAQRIAPLGWHLQLLMPIDQLLPLASLLRRLPVAIVFDHFGRISPIHCGSHPAHQLLLELLTREQAWLKLSGGYLVSATNSIDDSALTMLARSFIVAAPKRLVWGSDWPHATASAGQHPYPDDAQQIDQLAQWAEDSKTLNRILITNPEILYGF